MNELNDSLIVLTKINAELRGGIEDKTARINQLVTENRELRSRCASKNMVVFELQEDIQKLEVKLAKSELRKPWGWLRVSPKSHQ